MSKQILNDQLIFIGGYDLTGDSNAVALEYSSELKDSTTFTQGTRGNTGGLKTVQMQASGFYSADTQDANLFPNMGVSNQPVSIAAQGSTVGNVSYFFNAGLGELSSGESVGELSKYNMGAGAQGDLIRGVLAHNARSTAETSTGAGTSLQLGAASSTQSLHAVVHVLESSGSGDQTLDIVIQSDDNTDFTSAVSALTFSQYTTSVGSEILSLPGALTDDYFRASYTISGSGSPSFKFVVLFGIT